tara:strand:- start:619 stop:1032 length:414 start_codon:yes stop_codon:yes gene_type:complete
MTDEMDIGGELGKVKFRPPHSLTAINDACSEYMEFVGQGHNKAKLGRCLAAVLGLAWSEKNPKHAPKYNVNSGEIVMYGGAMLEWLFKKGVTRSTIYAAGHILANELFLMLPKEEEVSQKAESFPDQEEAGSGDPED